MRILLGFILCLLTTGAVQAQDDGLYAPKAPEGSAFVRFVNVGDASVEMKANNKSYGDMTSLESSAYYVLPEGDVSFSIDDKEAKAAVVAGEYYTISAMDNAFILKDAANDNRTKATLALYNLQGEGALTLKAKAGTVNVLENVSAGQSAARDINPVKIDLSVEQDGDEAIAVEPFIMERGNHYSVFYNGKEAFVVTATVDTTR